MPIRRYLRISRTAALEVRIYATGANKEWLDDSLLEELIQMIKPLILPKLREEREATKKKKGPTKDTVENGHFTASLWFVETDTRHVVMKTTKSLVFPTRKPGHAEAPLAGDSSPLFIASMEDEEESAIKDKPELVAKYQGFKIWGKKLMISVSKHDASSSITSAQRQQETQLLDNWITATQAPAADAD